jgi:hypothetical protein
MLTTILPAPGAWSQPQRSSQGGPWVRAPSPSQERAPAPGEREDVQDAVASLDLQGGPIRVSVRQTGGGVQLVSADYPRTNEPAIGTWSLPNGRLKFDAVDATATDTALTHDTIDVAAGWNGRQGNTYTVRCRHVLPGATFHYPFTIPGRYKYVCIAHEYAGMVGTVLVQGQVR